MLKIKQIEPNTGQIPGLPRNPRQIKGHRFEKLKKSIADFPEMLEMREIVVVRHGKIYVCIGGNMRLEAAKELGHTEIPAKVVPASWPVEKLAEFAIKDNVAFGEDDLDILANEWTDFDLIEYGMELSDGLLDVPDSAVDDGDAGDESFNYQTQFGVIVICKDEAEQKEIYERLLAEGFSCKVVVT